MDKLRSLGPVKVDHHMQSFRTDTRMKDMLRSRDISEQQAASSTSTRNRLRAGSLFDLLEERKFAKSREEVVSMAEKYDVDKNVLERVALTVNSPSVVEGSLRKVVGEDGEERETVQATWTDPIYAQNKDSRLYPHNAIP